MEICPKRLITNKALWDKLTDGSLSGLVDYVSNVENELDLQIRNNYLNIYYKGGNLLKIGPNSFWIDEFYFYNDPVIRKTHLLDAAKRGDSSAKVTVAGLKKKRDELLNVLRKDGDFATYFDKGKTVMNKWLEYLNTLGIRHQEKEDQQFISMNNRHGSSDYTVLDIEYMVSTLSDFNYNGSLEKSKPRFDVIAIDNATGRLVVIELKSGGGAVKGDSGIREHVDCFNHTIGRDHGKCFHKEMSNLCKQKQELGLLDNNLSLNHEDPEFVFAFSPKSGDPYSIDNFRKDCEEIHFYGRILTLDNNYRLFNSK